MNKTLDELKEKLAAIEHSIWTDWMDWLFDEIECGTLNKDGSFTILPVKVKHWKRQMATPYFKLTEKEKDGDREQVEKYWPIVEALINKARIEELKNLQMSEVEDLVKDEVFEHYIKDRVKQLKQEIKSDE